ncbi:hypothetical protein BJX61DRAFT_90092 [Aspergillus egyptiacus]|nr:hypothetical protein BJX61DRAFT_90092 [Aspergillus egyptiacus]
MSFPPPPGFQQPSSLPPRPPQPTNTNSQYGVSASTSRANYSATAFAPRSVASQQPYRTSSPIVSAAPSNPSGFSTPTPTSYGGYHSQPQPAYQAGPSYYGTAQYNTAAYGPSVPHIPNPFAPSGNDATRGKNFGRNDTGLDAETEAQIAQWQSAYASNDTSSVAKSGIRRDGTTGTPGASTTVYTSSGSTPASNTPVPTGETQKTVVRSGGGQSWTDQTLLEWDPAHFRLFVGNLAGEVTDDSLLKAFSKYTSVQKARVIRDKRTQKSKGYGFVSFSDGDDYFKAAREMQGKYIGSHPILLRRATTEVRPVSNNNNKNKKNGARGGGSGGNQGAKVKHDGIKKPGKTKGGLKILG